MEQNAREYFKEKVTDLVNAPSCCAEAKAAGAEYCDCPACTACAAILERQDELQ